MKLEPVELAQWRKKINPTILNNPTKFINIRTKKDPKMVQIGANLNTKEEKKLVKFFNECKAIFLDLQGYARVRSKAGGTHANFETQKQVSKIKIGKARPRNQGQCYKVIKRSLERKLHESH